MKIILNGIHQEIDDGSTIQSVLIDSSLNPDKVVVEYNLKIMKKNDFSKVKLKENDRLEVLNFVGGG